MRTDQDIEKLIDSDQTDEEEEVCETCGGSGVVTTMEAVYPNEPHMAPIGEENCPDCNSRGDIDDYE